MNAHTNAHVHNHTRMHVQHTNIHVHLRTQCHTHTCTHNTMCTQDGTSSLFIASRKGHDRVVEKLLQAGATVDLQEKVENCCYLFISHLCCAKHIMYHTTCTEENTYECQKAYPTQPLLLVLRQNLNQLCDKKLEVKCEMQSLQE